MGSGVGLFNFYRDSEVIVTSALMMLSLDVVAFPGCQLDPCTDLGGCLVEPIVAPLDSTVAEGNDSCIRRNGACSIVGVG